MYLLKLFHQSDPDQPVAAHMLREGVTRVGRDPAADWVIPDADCEISRTHLELDCRQGSLALKPLGANGVFRDCGAIRLADGAPISLALGDAVRLGKFRLVVDPIPFAAPAQAGANQTMVLAAPFGETASVPTDWSDAEPLPPLPAEASLLDAFCEGAGLDVSALSSEDPAEVMRRAGAIYRQMVLGLGDLMVERSSVKTEYRMDRTTIGARDNNPFKWAPTRRLATDLLKDGEAGFLPGPAAAAASFLDVKMHMLSTLAGFRATLEKMVGLTGPAAIEARLEGQSLFLKSRAAACWNEYARLHEELAREVADGTDGAVNRAFTAAYGDSMAAFDRAAPLR